MSKNSLTKRQGQRYHAQSRALRRYGVYLNRERRVRIIKAIQGGESVFVKKMTNRLSLHFLMICDVVLPVVYDKSRQSIATVLPKRVLRRHIDCYDEACNNGNVAGA